MTRRTAIKWLHWISLALILYFWAVEPDDADRTATALREAREEVGVDLSRDDVLGQMPVYKTGSGFEVTPVVALINQEPELTLDHNEVAETLSQYPGIKTANVYGVEIPGTDGRAGMASLTVAGEFDISELRAFLTKELPHYAVPLFIRIEPEAQTTGTFKYRKVELVEEGYDVSKVNNPIYFGAMGSDGYEPLTSEGVARINAGELRV